MLSAPLQAVVFDIDNTLFNHAHAEHSALQITLEYFAPHTAKHGVQLNSPTLLQTYRAVNEKLWMDMAHNLITPQELRHERFAETLRREFPHAAAEHLRTWSTEMGEMYLQHYGTYRQLLPYATETLEFAHKHFKTALLSNGFREQQYAKIQHFGWEHSVNAIILSSEVGVMKPHKAIFDAARTQLGIENPASMLYVGDHYESDVEGANSAGWKTVWFNPGHLHRTRNDAHYTIASLQELPAILQHFIP